MKRAEYKIDTLSDMLEIPPEAFERFLAELPDIMRRMKSTGEACKKLGAQIKLSGSVWVDDGKHDIELNFRACSDSKTAPNAEA